jgi:tRNA (guanosine-2'-O-)-methyltransferase
LTEKRLNKFKKVVSKRQKYLTVVIENVHDSHNVSAILRSAESIGIDRVYLIYNQEKFPRISSVSSASAKKWVEIVKFRTVEECFKELKKQKFKIYSTHMLADGRNTSLYELDLSKRVALVFGNEHRGVSDEVKNLADRNFLIPMLGMVQSLNVSVSVAVCLFEAMRQRENAGMYKKSAYTKKELKEKLEEYINK